MHFNLIDLKPDLCEHWQRLFKDAPDVSVYCADFFSVKADCIVSPANSFGFMDGGIDLLYSRTLGWQVQDRVQEKIRSEFHGELLVGQAVLVETGDLEVPWLIAAPTMRVPMVIDRTVNAYLAARAIFRLAKNLDHIEQIAIPGLGTGVGQLPPKFAARQIYQAYHDEWLGKYQFPDSWADSQRIHQRLYSENY